MIEPISLNNIRRAEELHLTSDSKAAVKVLSKIIIEIVKKINEIIEQTNKN